MTLREEWNQHAHEWVEWARTPGHDSYWRFHRKEFLSLVPPAGRLTVDVGCGEGRVGRDLIRAGHRVFALDASHAMVHAAVTHPERPLTGIVADAATLPIPAGAADRVVAHMSLQDVDDLERSVAEIARILEPGGYLVMAIVHPLNSAGRFVGEHGDPDRPFVITGSWFERRRIADRCERDGLGMTFHSEHRSLEDYVDALADSGFLVERIREVTEPDPADKWYRIPLFMDLRAIKR